MQGESESNTTIDAVKHSFEIIQKLQELDGAGVTELAAHLEMTKGGVYKHLQTLVELGFATQEDGTYRLSFEFLSVSQRLRADNIVYNVGASEVDDLAEESGVGAYLVMLEDVRAYCLYTAEGENSVGMAIEVGDKISVHSTCTGKAILSEVANERWDRLVGDGLNEKTNNTICDISELKREVRAARNMGIAFEDEENIYGMRGVAAPIEPPQSNTVGAVGAIGPVSLINDEQFTEALPELVLQTKNFIEVKSSLTPPTRLR